MKIDTLPIPKALRDAYSALGISELYPPQAECIEAGLFERKNILAAIPTASGKTLSCLLPVFAKLLEIPDATALLIYPTKALTRDQLLTIQEMDSALNAKEQGLQYMTEIQSRRHVPKSARAHGLF